MSNSNASLQSFVVEIMPNKRALAQLACLNKQFADSATYNRVATYDTKSLISRLQQVCKDYNLNDIGITFPLNMSSIEKKVEDATHRGITFHIGQDTVEMNILIMYHYDVQPSDDVTSTLQKMRAQLLEEFKLNLYQGKSMSTNDANTIEQIIQNYGGGKLDNVHISHDGLDNATITIIKEVVKDAVNKWCVFTKNNQCGGSKKNQKKVAKSTTSSSPSAKAKSTTSSSPSAKAKKAAKKVK